MTLSDLTGMPPAQRADNTPHHRESNAAVIARAVIENYPDLVFAKDLDGRHQLINSAAARFLNRPAREVLGKTVHELVDAASAQHMAEQDRIIIATGGTHVYEETFELHPGDPRTFVTTKGPITDDDGAVVGVFGVSRDITESKRAAEALQRSQQQLAQAQQIAGLGSWDWDVASGAVTLSAELHRLYLSDPKTFEPTYENFFERIHPDDRAAVAHAVSAAIENKTGFSVEHRIIRPDGVERLLLSAGEAQCDETGALCKLVGTAQDVTDRKRAENELIREREFLNAMLDSLEEGIVACDADGSLTLFNQAARNFHGLTAAPVGPDQWAHRYSLYRPDGQTLLEKDDIPLFRALSGETVREAEIVIAPDGSGRRTTLMNGQPFYDGHGTKLGAVVAMHDVTERRALEDRLAHQALHDALTGLPNRALFVDRLGHALRRIQRLDGAVAVLYMDLDNLKVVNDSLGHAVGNQLLVAVSGRLEGCLRPIDTVARLGGDEFTVLLEEVTDATEAIRLTQRIAATLREPFMLSGRSVQVSASTGIALSTTGREHPDDLLRRADVAMYRAKQAGKAQYKLFDSDMDKEARSRFGIQDELRQAIDYGQLRLHYQPKLPLTGLDEPIWMEALVRWEHPDRGLLQPADFLPLAEESGLIVELGRWVLTEACRQGRHWRDSRPGQSLAVCVNLAARQFHESQLAAEVEAALQTAGLTPDRLMLEVTESAMMQDVESAAATLRGLKPLGLKVAIDDFGTGYSSLSYLHHFPVDCLKIDRSFIANLESATHTRFLVQGIISLAHALGLTVAAEGVETSEQLAQLRGMGCDFAQGYYLARPLPADQAAALVSKLMA